MEDEQQRKCTPPGERRFSYTALAMVGVAGCSQPGVYRYPDGSGRYVCEIHAAEVFNDGSQTPHVAGWGMTEVDLETREREYRRAAALGSIRAYVEQVAKAAGRDRDRAVRHLLEQTADRVADRRVTFAEGASTAGYTTEAQLKALLAQVAEIREGATP